jgi:hypothetical protein
MFEKHPEHKPISIIITTLAAHAYSGEQSLSQTLRAILKGMADHIEYREGTAWIANPVNPEENFADKWPEEPKKQENFFAWLERARRDFGLYVLGHDYRDIPGDFVERMTPKTMANILRMFSVTAPAVVSKPEAALAHAKDIEERGGATKPWAE